MTLDGKNILVTGGSSGIGKAAAAVCCERGARVLLCARGERQLEVTAAELNETFPGRVRHIVCDVADAPSVARAMQAFAEYFGRLHGVIHAAAVLGPIGTFTDVDADEWEQTIRINLVGTFNVTREACSLMRTTGGGRIVLFAGGGGGAAFPQYTAYACSKVAVVRFTETTAIEMEPHSIEINCVAPGMVATPMHEGTLRAGRAAGEAYLRKTQQLLRDGGVSPLVGARAAAFLVSDAARGITGKFVAAPYDAYEEWPNHLQELRDQDIFLLRRVVPRERQMDWQ